MHRSPSCIDRDPATGQVRAVKIRLDPNSPWRNEIAADGRTAVVAANPKTRIPNNRLWSGQDVFHVISYRVGEFGTNYNGRFRCVGGKEQTQFHLQFVDDGTTKTSAPTTPAAAAAAAPAAPATAAPPVVAPPTVATNLVERWSHHLTHDLMLPHTLRPCEIRDLVGAPTFWVPALNSFLHVQSEALDENDMRRWSTCARLGFSVVVATGSGPHAAARWSMWRARQAQPAHHNQAEVPYPALSPAM